MHQGKADVGLFRVLACLVVAGTVVQFVQSRAIFAANLLLLSLYELRQLPLRLASAFAAAAALQQQQHRHQRCDDVIVGSDSSESEMCISCAALHQQQQWQK